MTLGVGIALDFDTRDHAFGNGDFIAANRKANDGDSIAPRRKITEFRNLDTAHERLVLHLQERQIRVVTNAYNLGDDFIGGRNALHLNKGRIRHDMGARENLSGFDDDTGARAGCRRASLPRRVVIGFLLGSVNSYNSAMRHCPRLSLWVDLRCLAPLILAGHQFGLGIFGAKAVVGNGAVGALQCLKCLHGLRSGEGAALGRI